MPDRIITHHISPYHAVQGTEAEVEKIAHTRHVNHGAGIAEAMQAAYLAGFYASAEGYNAEYPFDQRGIEPFQDDDWLRYRDVALLKLTSFPTTDTLALPTMADPWDRLIADAIGEAQEAMRKFPQPNYVISKVAEEAGEVVKAAIHTSEGRETVENLRGEIKQLVAMLYRLWLEGDQVHGLPPASTGAYVAKAEGAPVCATCRRAAGLEHQSWCPEDGIVTEAQTYGGRHG